MMTSLPKEAGLGQQRALRGVILGEYQNIHERILYSPIAI